jgi:hypothetical protein
MAQAERALDGIRRELDSISGVDHHAHLMRADDGVFALGDDAAPLSELILESNEPERMRGHVRVHPSHGRALRDLAQLLGVERDEAAIAQARSELGHAAYTRLLLTESRLEAIYVDDGLNFPDLMSMQEQQQLTGIPVRRVARIEVLVQDAANGWPAFDVLLDRFRTELSNASADGLVGLKTIAAFRCGLDLPEAEVSDARAGYERWRISGSPRLIDPHMISFFLDEALEVTASGAGERLPLQVHAGLVGTDVDLRAGDPAVLRTWLNRPTHRGIPVVLLHCYPYLREASWLASLYPDVYLDLSMSMQWAGSHMGTAMISEVLGVAPVSKLLFGTDGFRVPELFYLGARWWRDSLAQFLMELIDLDYVSESTALSHAELVLRGNAHIAYRT